MLLIVKPALFVPFVSTDQNPRQNKAEFAGRKGLLEVLNHSFILA
jgi:hypothetical protein